MYGRISVEYHKWMQKVGNFKTRHKLSYTQINSALEHFLDVNSLWSGLVTPIVVLENLFKTPLAINFKIFTFVQGRASSNHYSFKRLSRKLFNMYIMSFTNGGQIFYKH